MSNHSHCQSFRVPTGVIEVILFTGIVFSLTSPVSAAEASINNRLAGYAKSATYSDANQLDAIIHTTSDDLPSKMPLSNTDEIKPSDGNAESVRVPPSTQELPPTRLETLPSGNEPPPEP